MKALFRGIRYVLAGFVLLVVGYVLAGIGGSLIPANADWREPDTGITIYIHDNGVHTGIVLPRRNALADWSDLVRPDHLGDRRYASDHLLFGWGDRTFYLETPTWGDLRPSTAIAALFGSDASLVHVDHIAAPAAADDLRPVRITPSQYRHIASAIRAQFALDEAGASQPVPGYGPADIFYEAHGRYTAFRTCNEWTGAILRNAGVRIGAWTPFNFSVMRWFETPAG
ncbi:TIGR02117 family protein [Parasphingopyxis algicola]|uniref:TIGR02117 family protein n=1 Tax=Parasphingopyxis algicola TaxID=2026624 RepID=UPI001FE7A467|nr:TIGR02117 family protein [Parasphingopyxis algicola]